MEGCPEWAGWFKSLLATESAPGPLKRTIPTPEFPGGVAIAAIVETLGEKRETVDIIAQLVIICVSNDPLRQEFAVGGRNSGRIIRHQIPILFLKFIVDFVKRDIDCPNLFACICIGGGKRVPLDLCTVYYAELGRFKVNHHSTAEVSGERRPRRISGVIDDDISGFRRCEHINKFVCSVSAVKIGKSLPDIRRIKLIRFVREHLFAVCVSCVKDFDLLDIVCIYANAVGYALET